MASVEEILAKMPETYYAGVVGTMVNLEKLIKNDEKTEITLLLQHPDILQMWMLVESNIADIETGKELSKQKGQEAYLNYLLMVRDISRRYKELGNRYLKAFTDVIDQYDGWLVGDWISDEAVDFYLEQGYVLECYKISKEFLHETNKQSLNARGEADGALSKIRGVVLSVIASGHNKLKSIAPDDVTLMHALEESLRDYARQVYKKMERDLRHEAQKFKEKRNAPLTPEVWGDVLANENRSIELARDGKLTSEKYIDDEHHEGFSDETKKQMEDSYPLMQKILDISMDDSLFDFEYGLEPHINLLSVLNVHNIDVFHELILRHNIIRCGACPELKAKFERWMQGEEVRTDSASATTDNTRAEQEELCHLIHPKWWGNDDKKLEIHNEIKGLVTNYGVQDICSYLNEMKQQERVMLPTGVQQAFDELQRMGMPTEKEGYNYKTFARYYNK